MKNKNLTKEEFELLVKLSKEKMLEMVKRTDKLYNEILNRLYKDKVKENKAFTDGVHSYIINEIENNPKKGINLYRKTGGWVSWVKKDPYFQANLKVLYPVVKYCYYDRGWTTTMLKRIPNPNQDNYNERLSRTVSQTFWETIGSGNMLLIKKVFRELGDEYYKKLVPKFGDRFGINVVENAIIKGSISTSIPCEILGKMIKYGKIKSNRMCKMSETTV